jgi:hypothetical protein
VPYGEIWRPAGALTAISAIIAVASVWNGRLRDPPPTPRIVLLYVGAEDCAPCRAWQRDEKMVLQASAEFPRLVYREVKSPTLFDILKDENWPEDLREYRDQLRGDAGVPIWFVIADGRVVQRGMGPAQWRNEVFPKIRSLLH